MANIALINATLGLRRAGILSMTQADGIRINCRSGLLWVTSENDPTDYWLHDGESVVVDAPGRVVVQAERDSWLEILRSDEVDAKEERLLIAA
jgi:hypothetical protein